MGAARRGLPLDLGGLSWVEITGLLGASAAPEGVPRDLGGLRLAVAARVVALCCQDLQGLGHGVATLYRVRRAQGKEAAFRHNRY